MKGFRDFLPAEARKRQYVIDTLRKVFESYGFEPLETPALEYEEILAGKYGEEGERLMYKFEDKGRRKVALRYDQTVPLARVVAQYQNRLPLPFKRYQIQNVWRGENPQAGRFREFIQCDIDTVGTSSLLADVEIIACALDSLYKLGLKRIKLLINDRSTFEGIDNAIISSIDKYKKVGKEGVLRELTQKGMKQDEAETLLNKILLTKPNARITKIFDLIRPLLKTSLPIEFDPILARGLDYYTGLIFEIEIEGYDVGSVCGGGRYDNLIGMFGDKQIAAVGCSFGFDRVIEAMTDLNLFPDELLTTKVLVTVFSEELLERSLEVISNLRKKEINTEVYPDADAKMDKQLKYADQKNIPYVVLIGPKEAESDSATIKNMKTGEQKTVKIEDMVKIVK